MYQLKILAVSLDVNMNIAFPIQFNQKKMKTCKTVRDSFSVKLPGHVSSFKRKTLMETGHVLSFLSFSLFLLNVRSIVKMSSSLFSDLL